MNKPLLLFDGDCGFCRGWIRRWTQITGDRVDYAPWQEAGSRFPQIQPQEFKTSVHLIEPDGRHTRAAEAVALSLHYGGRRWPLWIYQNIPGARWISEAVYKFIAGHRPLAGSLTRLFWGAPPLRSTYQITRALFLRGVALVYFVAFVSFGMQILGLIGSQGILPAHDFLERLQVLGIQRFFLAPTLAWISASDHFLEGLCVVGSLFSVGAFLGFAPGLLFFGQWLFYLSLVTIGGDFMSFQWDALLLETGVLAVFFAPWVWTSAKAAAQPASRVMLWMVRWLLFRLMLQSAWVKWNSGDPLWHHLTALSVHFQTQPLPNALAWFAHQLPSAVHTGMCVMVFVIEGYVPFLIFTPRRSRLVAFGFLAALQVIILMTGNYCFFNLLTLVLCLTLVDDRTWVFLMRKSWIAENPLPDTSIIRRSAACFIFVVSLIFWAVQLGIRPPKPVAILAESVYPLRSINDYGLFAEMTPTRPEIIMEGSDDGREWKAYEFKYKPQGLDQRPWQVAPFQPRLDWQMWFAALSTYRQNPWFLQFCVRLLQSSPPVLELLKTNPFPDHPPRYLRASLYEYRFTTIAERQATGNWWTRNSKGLYMPPISLKT